MRDDERPVDLDDAMRQVLVERMAERQLSQVALGRVIGKSSATMSNQLRGIGRFSLADWDAAASALGDDLEGLLEAARRKM